MTISDFFRMHLFAVSFPVVGGLMLYGWRAGGVILTVMLSAALGYCIWSHIGQRGRQLRMMHCLWISLLLALVMPAHLFSDETLGGAGSPWHPWPMLPAAGLLATICSWLLGGLGSSRVHPVLVSFLLLFIMFEPAMTEHRVLEPAHVFSGDIMEAAAPDDADAAAVRATPWLAPVNPHGAPATWSEPAASRLILYSTDRELPDRGAVSMQTLIRDRLPPLENLVVAGNPGPIGASSAIAVIMGGLYLLYRGLIDYKVPLLSCLSAWMMLLILPTPVVITESATQWRWLALRAEYVGWPAGLTFANYELFAGPLLFASFFLATAPSVRPMTSRGRAVYAMIFGIFAAFFQLYASVAVGPYIALLIATLCTPTIDRFIAPKPLV